MTDLKQPGVITLRKDPLDRGLASAGSGCGARALRPRWIPLALAYRTGVALLAAVG